MATGGGAGGDVRNEDDLMRQSRELLAGDRLGSLATREKRTRPTTREREDLEEARARLHNPRSQEDLVARGTQLSEHVLGRALDLGSGGFLEERVEEVEHDRLSIKSEESENGPEIGDAVRHGRRAEDRVSGFVDVTKMSAASRRSAAPHIYNIFEQIFVDTDSGAHQRPAVPDLPAEVRASMRASGVNLDEELGLTGSRAEVVMTIDESWKQLTRGTGNPSGLEKQLVSDLAIALRVPKSRFQITGVKPSGMGSRAVAELVILPGSEGEPQAVEVAEALSLQAGTPQSMLASMTSTKRASNVRFREVQPAVAKAMQGGESGPYQALLRGGVVLDDRGIRPALSAYQSMAPTQLMQSSPKQGVSGGAGGLGAHQRDLETIRMVESARRRQEGFWVDVDRGLYQPVQSVHKYGTFRAPGRNKVCRQLVCNFHAFVAPLAMEEMCIARHGHTRSCCVF